MKYLLWALVIYLAWRWYSAQKKMPRQQGKDNKDRADDLHAGGAEKMVQCSHCGIHLPASEAVAGSDRQLFCSDAHRISHQSS